MVEHDNIESTEQGWGRKDGLMIDIGRVYWLKVLLVILRLGILSAVKSIILNKFSSILLNCAKKRDHLNINYYK